MKPILWNFFKFYICYSWALVITLLLEILGLGIWRQVCFKICTPEQILKENIIFLTSVLLLTGFIFIFNFLWLNKHQKTKKILLYASIPSVLFSIGFTIQEIFLAIF